MAVQGRELRRGEQTHHPVLLQGLQAQVEVRRHAPQIHRAPDASEQIVHRIRSESHVHARRKRSGGLHRFVAHAGPQTDLVDPALRDVGDQDLHRHHRNGFVHRAQEGLHTRHVAPVARQDQGVQIGEGLHRDVLFQRLGDDLLDLRHGAVDERKYRRRRETVRRGRSEDPDAPFGVIAVRRAFEQHREQRLEIRPVHPDARREVHRRLEVVVQLQLVAQVENHVLHVAPRDAGRDAPQRVHTQFVGRELPPPHIGGACGRLAALRGRLLAPQRPHVLRIPFGKQTVDRGERPQRVVERHTTHVARDLAVVQRFGDDDVARRETCDLLRHVDQTFAAQVVAQRRVGGRVGDVGIGRRNRRRCRRKDREDVARRGHVQPILAAEKAYQIVHTGPAEVARHGDVLHAAHRHVHAAGARDITQQLRQRQPTRRDVHLPPERRVAPDECRQFRVDTRQTQRVGVGRRIRCNRPMERIRRRVHTSGYFGSLCRTEHRQDAKK